MDIVGEVGSSKDDTDFALVGISLGNSYFNAHSIDRLLRHVKNSFSQVRIMIPDKPAKHTYKAIGYTEATAERKARLSGNTLQNHSQASIDLILEEDPETDIELIEWQDQVEPNSFYQASLSEISRLYEQNEGFREDVRAATRDVIEKRLKLGKDIEEAVNEGAHYLLEELAFLSASPKIFEVEKVTYVYHNEWPILEKFLNGDYTGEKREDLGFSIVMPS